MMLCRVAIGQRNNIQLEIGGNSILGFSYENQFKENERGNLFVRAGVSYFPVDGHFFVIPTEFGQIFGKEKHHFELSTGLTLGSGNHQSSSVSGGIHSEGRYYEFIWFNRIGYRYQKPDGKFVFRFGFTPLFGNFEINGDSNYFLFRPWGGISFGYVLKGKDKE